MKISYADGFLLSGIAAVVCGAISFVALTFGGFAIRKPKDSFHNVFLGSMTALSTFALLYALINTALQSTELLSTHAALLREELANGILALRFSSILIGGKSLLHTLDLIIADNLLLAGRLLSSDVDEYKEFDKLQPAHSEGSLDRIVSAQDGVYLLVISCLWIFTVNGVRTITITVLNWALFYIVDDWAIMVDYARLLKGRWMKWHRLRIALFNFLLFVLTTYTLFSTYHWILAILSVFLMLLFFFWRYFGIDSYRY